MALQVKAAKRTFTFDIERNNTVNLPDVPGFTPEQVMDFYAPGYPQLTTAKIEGPVMKDGDTVEYRFVTNLGTKG